MSSARGRSSGRPNLAMAGKKEDVKKNAASSDSRGRGRGGGVRGARGRGSERGRGRGGPFHKQDLIQTSGVFSQGLGGDFPTRGRKEADSDVPVFNVIKKDQKEKRTDTEVDETKKDGKFSTSFKGWDDLWCSDGEDDDEILKSLLPKGIISDYTKGTVMPLVLPKEDESQFIQVLHRKVKEEIMSDGEDEKKELMDIVDRKYKVDKISDQLDPTLKYSKKAAEAVNSTDTGSKRPDFFLLQLPSIIGSLCRTHIQEPIQEVKMEVDAVEDLPAEESTSAFVDDVIPRGQTIGKLQITKRGRVLLKIGDHLMDVTKTLSGGQREAIVLLETKKQQEEQHPLFGGIPNVVEQGENAMYHIGTVRHHLMASIVWNGLNQHQNDDPDEPEPMETEVGQPNAKLQMELKELEKQQKTWSAEKWAEGT